MFQDDKIALLQKKMGQTASASKSGHEKVKKSLLPEKIQKVVQRSNSIISFFKNEDTSSKGPYLRNGQAGGNLNKSKGEISSLKNIA